MDRKSAAWLKYSKNGKTAREAQEAAWRANDPEQIAALARGAEMMRADRQRDDLRQSEDGAFTPEAAGSHAWRGDHT